MGGFQTDNASLWNLATTGSLKGEKEESEPAPQAPKPTAVEATHAPDAPKANVNKSLLEQQGEARRKRLLFQSTGRPPQGPTIETQTPTQQRTSLF